MSRHAVEAIAVAALEFRSSAGLRVRSARQMNGSGTSRLAAFDA